MKQIEKTERETTKNPCYKSNPSINSRKRRSTRVDEARAEIFSRYKMQGTNRGG